MVAVKLEIRHLTDKFSADRFQVSADELRQRPPQKFVSLQNCFPSVFAV
jgi:hypothetical protein